MDRQLEVEHLTKAEAHIAAGETRVIEQAMRVESLRVDGHDTEEAERLLGLLKATLAEWRRHRDTIVQQIEQIDASLA